MPEPKWWEQILAVIPWRVVIPVLLSALGIVGAGEVRDREIEGVSNFNTKLTYDVVFQMQLEIAELQAQVDSLKQGR